MKDICSFERAAQAIQVHALAMFLPSFLTPLLVTRVGLERLLPSGFLLLAAAGGAVVAGTNYQAIVAGLLLLGLGWNLTYVGGSALLAQSVDDASRHRWQGVNDTFVAVCATLGAFLPAPLVVWPGWRGSNVLVALVCTCAAGWCVWIFSRRVPCGASRVAHGPQ
jgi:MFS family permease